MGIPGADRLPLWMHYAVPAVAGASTFLLYFYRGNLVHLAHDWVVSRKVPAGKTYLSGNFGPVEDERFEEVPVTSGKLPAGLDGAYVRTGPNPALPPVAGYHWFDGDGMLHSVRIKGGKVTYCNRYVDTARLAQERAAARPLFPKMGDMFGKVGLAVLMLNQLAVKLGVVSTKDGAGTANTALTYHAGRLMALNEGDLPYSVRVLCSGLLETVGRFKFDSSWRGPFTAHPKTDSATGDLMFIGYSFESKPYVRAGVMDKSGALVRRWGVDVPYPTMMHDMAATRSHLVVLHLPLVFDPKVMVEKNGLPFVLDKKLPGRLGLLRRDQPSAEQAEVQWFEVPGPGFMAFHVAASFEDNQGRVKVYACQQDNVTLDLDAVNCEQELGRLTEYCLDPKTGTATSRRMSEVVCDFPVHNPATSSSQCRYTWAATMDTHGSTPSFTGIAKFDLTTRPGRDACVGRIAFPPGCYGGEAVFVPRAGGGDPREAAKAGEDDGLLAVFVYNSEQDSSTFQLYDARTMSAKPVAVVALPRRVPYGFHGTWVSGRQIKEQLGGL